LGKQGDKPIDEQDKGTKECDEKHVQKKVHPGGSYKEQKL
jgi:hypothetical protein